MTIIIFKDKRKYAIQKTQTWGGRFRSTTLEKNLSLDEAKKVARRIKRISGDNIWYPVKKGKKK